MSSNRGHIKPATNLPRSLTVGGHHYNELSPGHNGSRSDSPALDAEQDMWAEHTQDHNVHDPGGKSRSRARQKYGAWYVKPAEWQQVFGSHDHGPSQLDLQLPKEELEVRQQFDQKQAMIHEELQASYTVKAYREYVKSHGIREPTALLRVRTPTAGQIIRFARTSELRARRHQHQLERERGDQSPDPAASQLPDVTGAPRQTVEDIMLAVSNGRYRAIVAAHDPSRRGKGDPNDPLEQDLDEILSPEFRAQVQRSLQAHDNLQRHNEYMQQADSTVRCRLAQAGLLPRNPPATAPPAQQSLQHSTRRKAGQDDPSSPATSRNVPQSQVPSSPASARGASAKSPQTSPHRGSNFRRQSLGERVTAGSGAGISPSSGSGTDSYYKQALMASGKDPRSRDSPIGDRATANPSRESPSRLQGPTADSPEALLIVDNCNSDCELLVQEAVELGSTGAEEEVPLAVKVLDMLDRDRRTRRFSYTSAPPTSCGRIGSGDAVPGHSQVLVLPESPGGDRAGAPSTATPASPSRDVLQSSLGSPLNHSPSIPSPGTAATVVATTFVVPGTTAAEAEVLVISHDTCSQRGGFERRLPSMDARFHPGPRVSAGASASGRPLHSSSSTVPRAGSEGYLQAMRLLSPLSEAGGRVGAEGRASYQLYSPGSSGGQRLGSKPSQLRDLQRGRARSFDKSCSGGGSKSSDAPTAKTAWGGVHVRGLDRPSDPHVYRFPLSLVAGFDSVAAQTTRPTG